MYRDFAETPAAYNAWIRTLQQDHERRILARVMKLDHSRLGWFDDILDGQVSIAVENRDSTRVGSLRLFDPTQSIGMEPDSPSTLPIHKRRMVQVVYEINVPGYGWMGPPVITGPVVDFGRDGAEVTITINGKEKLALGSFGRTHSWKKGRKKVDVIRDILLLAGESSRFIHLPPLKATLHKPFNVSRTDKPLVAARKLAHGMGWYLFPDGRGHWRMRTGRNKEPLRPFIDKDWLCGPLGEDPTDKEFFNGWIVKGDNPRGPKPRIQSDLIALPEAHPYSAQTLGADRNNKPYWVIHEETRNGVKTKERANKIARRQKDLQVEAHSQSTVEMLPLPNVEEWDLLRAIDPLTGGKLLRVKEATIPLVSGTMTIGSVRRVSVGGKRHHG